METPIKPEYTPVGQSPLRSPGDSKDIQAEVRSAENSKKDVEEGILDACFTKKKSKTAKNSISFLFKTPPPKNRNLKFYEDYKDPKNYRLVQQYYDNVRRQTKIRKQRGFLSASKKPELV